MSTEEAVTLYSRRPTRVSSEALIYLLLVDELMNYWTGFADFVLADGDDVTFSIVYKPFGGF